MKKKKKIKILEILILITIIISLGTIIWLTYTYFNNQVAESETNAITDYSYSKITMYQPGLDKLNDYNLPYINNIDTEKSYYKVFIKSTDNLITGYSEIIYIKYIDSIENEDFTTTEIDIKEIKKYCNSINLVEHDYVLSCKYDDNTIYIKNDINLPVDLIKHKDIKLLFTKNQKLNEYLKELEGQEIPYQIVNEIK